MGKGSRLRARASKPRTETVSICSDGEITGELRHLAQELQKAEREDDRSNKAPQAPRIARRIRDLEGQAEEATVELVLRGIGPQWEKMIADHPPTDAQKKKQPGVDHNPETFPYAAVAASIVTVDGEPSEETAETLHEFFDPLPQGEWAKVWGTCLAVNVGENTVPFNGRVSKHLHGSEPSSTSVGSGVSLEAIS